MARAVAAKLRARQGSAHSSSRISEGKEDIVPRKSTVHPWLRISAKPAHRYRYVDRRGTRWFTG
jgi:hypothetical protein